MPVPDVATLTPVDGDPWAGVTLTPLDRDPFAEPLTIHAANWHPKEVAAADQSGAAPMPGEGSPSGPLPQMYPPSVDRGFVTPVETPHAAPDIAGAVSDVLYGNPQGFSTAADQVQQIPAQLDAAAKDTTNPMIGRVAAALPLAIGEEATNIGKGLWSAATLPGDVYTGKVDPFSEEGLDRTFGLASTLVQGGMGAAEPEAAGIFGGRLAQTADVGALKQAKKMQKQGFDRSAIRDYTGWHQNSAKDWQFEIPDYGAILKNPNGATLGDLLHHPQLFKAYPETANIPMTPDEGLSSQAVYYPINHELGGETGAISFRPQSSSLLQDILHEANHAVQDREDFSFGGGSGQPAIQEAAKAINANPDSLTARLVGEVGSRNVEARSQMSRDDLREIPPWETEDTPDKWQVPVEELWRQYGASKGGAESFNAPYFWRWKKNSDRFDSTMAEFYSEAKDGSLNNLYKVYAWPKEYQGKKVIDFSFSDSSDKFNLTNSEPNTAQKVLATTLDVIKDYVKGNPKSDYVTFSADANEPSRVRLYRFMANRLAKGVKEVPEEGAVRFIVPTNTEAAAHLAAAMQ